MPIATDPIDPNVFPGNPATNPGGIDPNAGTNCPPNTVYDAALNQCVPQDQTTALPPPPGSEDTTPVAGNQCRPGTYWSEQYQTCVAGEQEQDTTCPPGYTWNGLYGLCTYDDGGLPGIPGGSEDPGTTPCPEGQIRGSNGECQDDLRTMCFDPQSFHYNTDYCDRMRNRDDPNVPTKPGTSPPGGTTLPPVGGAQDPYQTEMPPVSPYDISESPDWMNSPTGTGGVSAIDPQAEQFGYGEVADFSDAAWQNARRYLDPQMQLQDERYAQELINQGIDPYSEAGQKAFRQKEMSQADLMSKSAFDALGFGAGIQNQMFGQDAARSQLANALLQSQMGLTQRGHEFDIGAGMQSNQQAFDQMMGLEGLNYRDYLSSIDQSRYQDSLALALAGLAPAPSYGTINTGMPEAPLSEYKAGQDLWANLWS